ncbi:hypothetical protein DXG01_016228 [Tephrocybe rancida]|nr:hypothetical protein DXG01_016228 [Tephrocybe rancida]
MASAIVSASPSLATILATLGVATVTIAAIQSLGRRSASESIYELRGTSFLVAWPFFTKRYDFIWANFKKTGAKMFRFHVLYHSVVALSGNVARKSFFNEPGLELRDGYAIFMGAAPRLSDINIEGLNRKGVSVFVRQLLNILRKERVAGLLPVLFNDVQARMEGWGKEGTLNLFTEVYDLVFQMTARLASCRELTEDKEALSQLAQNYWDLETSATPFALLFPWFPGPAKRAKQRATQNLYDLLSGFVELRRKATVPSSDAIDMLIAEGETGDAIVGFVLDVIFAGVINTGMNVCWNLLYLGMNPEWKAKVAAEVQALLDNHTDTISSQPLHQRLATIPMSAWEDEMPVLESVIRETLRIVGSGTLLRRNMGNDIEIDGSTISRGEFLAFSVADVHHNPDIYPEPLSFDPTRYDEGRAEDKKDPHGYVGWGSGKSSFGGIT